MLLPYCICNFMTCFEERKTSVTLFQGHFPCCFKGFMFILFNDWIIYFIGCMVHNLYNSPLDGGHLGRLLFLADFCFCSAPSCVGSDGKEKMNPGQVKVGGRGACRQDARMSYKGRWEQIGVRSQANTEGASFPYSIYFIYLFLFISTPQSDYSHSSINNHSTVFPRSGCPKVIFGFIGGPGDGPHAGLLPACGVRAGKSTGTPSQRCWVDKDDGCWNLPLHIR